MSDQRGPTELCLDIEEVEPRNCEELPDILLQKAGLRLVPWDVDALGGTGSEPTLSCSDWTASGTERSPVRMRGVEKDLDGAPDPGAFLFFEVGLGIASCSS